MNTTQTVQIAGRTYSFTTEGATERRTFTTVGTLYNSRGQFAGYVNRVNATGHLSVTGGPKCSVRDEQAALATLAL